VAYTVRGAAGAQSQLTSDWWSFMGQGNFQTKYSLDIKALDKTDDYANIIPEDFNIFEVTEQILLLDATGRSLMQLHRRCKFLWIL